jgi:hypothetical protein
MTQLQGAASVHAHIPAVEGPVRAAVISRTTMSSCDSWSVNHDTCFRLLSGPRPVQVQHTMHFTAIQLRHRTVASSPITGADKAGTPATHTCRVVSSTAQPCMQLSHAP